MSKKAVHIFLSKLKYESRLEKICRSTLKLGLVNRIEVYGLWETSLRKHENFDGIHYYRIATLSKTMPLNNKWLKLFLAIFSFLQYQLIVAVRIIKLKPSFTVIHNAALLPIGVFAGKLANAKIVYEPHELESEQPGMSSGKSMLIRNIEKIFIKSCHSVVSVSEPIAAFYSKKFKIQKEQLFVVSNQPENPYFGSNYPKTQTFRLLFKIPEEAVIFLYQGGLDESRGIRDYLNTFSSIGPEYHIVFMGYGEMEKDVIYYAERHKNIHFKEAVPVAEILKYTASADVGLIVIPDPDMSSSYKLSLSNKFFEYAICGLHICVSNNLELMSRIIFTEELGSVIGSEKENLKQWIIASKKENLIIMSEKSKLFRKNVGWQREEEKYNLIYRS